MTTSNFDTVLVANRGEIAVRVLRSARAAGYRTVAVHSDPDADAVHVRMADLAVRIGPAAARDSYLAIDRVIEAAVASGAGAIHPGYGFLAENADFAEACADAGIVFIGPSPEAIRIMGDKAAAKRLLVDTQVPLLAGYQGQEQSDERLHLEAASIGFPLMVKAAAGGGGKGMRLVASPDELGEALAGARREAARSFGSDVLILERALLRPRHVEVQVLADQFGHTISLGERDCSVQRRHQKVVEEAPSPALDDTTRAAMGRAAVEVAAAVGYVGAGTVEFLLGEDGTFAFLEMNTRLQVEHPVTEMVTGIDLVDWQLRIAAGQPLTMDASDVRIDGHAIEVRLYAEDPANDFLPQVGTIGAWQVPTGPGLRVDAGVAAGTTVSSDYDPMLAKVIAHGRDRDEARRRLAAALDELVCLGVRTNRAMLAWVLREPAFVEDDVSTAFLDEHPWAPAPTTARHLAAVAAHLHLAQRDEAARRSPQLAGWTNAAWLASPLHLRLDGETTQVRVAAAGNELVVHLGEGEFRARRVPGGIMVDGQLVSMTVLASGDGRALVRMAHADLDVEDVLLAAVDTDAAHGAGELLAPMHGAVTSVPVAVGDRVARGDAVVVMEAMKMEHIVRADTDGTITTLAALGAQVASGDVVGTIEPAHLD